MINSSITGFPSEVQEKLGYYVYRLIDPRDGETFYVGKGKGNRVFCHARAEVEGDELSNKLKRIREILLAGLEVIHVVHRHGMTEPVAFEVEAALIDAYPGLSNAADGQGNGDCGAMHATEIMKKYAAMPAELKHRVLLININRTAAQRSIYEAVRYAWKVNPVKAADAEVVLATCQGLVVGAFIAHQWLEAMSENFPDRESVPGRHGFIGKEAPIEMQEQYVGKRVPDQFRKQGAANPVKYGWPLKSEKSTV